jgi:hypothetical protein
MRYPYTGVGCLSASIDAVACIGELFQVHHLKIILVAQANIARDSQTTTHQTSHAQLPELHDSLKIPTSSSQLQHNNDQLSGAYE